MNPLRSSFRVAAWFELGLLLGAVPFSAHAAAAPAPAACPAPAKAGANGPIYLLPSAADIVTLLPPPPAADSPEQQADLAAVLEAQRAARADGTVAHAVADVDANCGRFADVIGDALTAKNNAKVLAFLNKAAHEGAAVAGTAKRYWKRTRPYAFSAQVERLGDMSPDWKTPPDIDTAARTDAPSGTAGAPRDGGGPPAGGPPGGPPGASQGAPPGVPNCAPKADVPATGQPAKPDPAAEAKAKKDKEKAARELARSSYPSGHATYGTVCAILLADMVPEKRVALFARSRDYQHSRMVVGAHYPSDLESGRLTGTLATALLMQNPKFQFDFIEARAALRAALGLPVQLPDLEPDKETDKGVDAAGASGAP